MGMQPPRPTDRMFAMERLRAGSAKSEENNPSLRQAGMQARAAAWHGKPEGPNGKPEGPNGKPEGLHGKPEGPHGKPEGPNDSWRQAGKLALPHGTVSAW
eukprot:361263-Chlamydomonas_euryale.AAC.4